MVRLIEIATPAAANPESAYQVLISETTIDGTIEDLLAIPVRPIEHFWFLLVLMIGTAGRLVVDVGGGTTDIAVIHEGGVQGTKMFGIGGRSFTRTIAADMDLSYEDAEKLKKELEEQGATVELK